MLLARLFLAKYRILCYDLYSTIVMIHCYLYMPKNLYPSREFSSSELKISYWLVTHRLAIIKLFKILLIIIDVLLVIISIILWGKYVSDIQKHQLFMRSFNTQLIDWPTVQAHLKARPIEILVVDAVNIGLNESDFIAVVRNPNPKRWLKSFAYRFVWAGGSTNWQHSFMMPNETKHVLALSKTGKNISSIKLETAEFDWKRIGKIYTSTVLEQRDRIRITKSNFTSKVLNIEISSVVFEIANETPFTYREVGFKILLKSGEKYIGAHFITLSNLHPEEPRIAEVRWQKVLPFPSEIIIEPEINYFDDTLILL